MELITPNKIQQEYGVDVNSDVYQERLDDLDKMLNEVITGIDVDFNKDVKKIEEYYFVNIFLPIFLGEVQVSHGATISDWINYAGGHYNPVDVIGKDGAVLFRVPGVYNRNTVNARIDRNANIADIMSMAKKHHEISPKRGDKFRVDGLNSILDNMNNADNFVNELNAWNEIFKRYNKGFNLAVKNNSVDISNDTNQQNDKNDELIYD